MTPKEKAEELLDKFKIYSNDYIDNRQCALIAVDEILNNFGHYKLQYWEEVKQEIEKI